ncbi:MAG: hypothetical protein KGN36_02400 [Acidobacteriota bacterium]|nr:hypothetical protein [Acidobacteriota bacterium]
MSEAIGFGEETAIFDQYSLEHWVGGDRAAGYFTARGADGGRALLKLMPEDAAEAERQWGTWQRARHLRHEHILELRGVGRLETDGERYVYAAYEYPEDRLTAALDRAPLTEEEARGVVEAVLDALRYLHGQGLVHGTIDAIDAAHIVACGESVKLITDSPREPEGMEAYAEDVRQVGELIRRLRAPESPGELLATLARHATDTDVRSRWTLAEMARLIEAPLPLPPPAPRIEAEVDERPALPPPHVRRITTEAGTPLEFPKWIFAAVGILLLAILGLNLRHKPASATAPQAAPAAPAAAPVRADSPARDAKATPAPPLVEPVRTTAGAARAMWRVIAYTYASYDMAARKAKQVNQRWPDLRAVVFVPGERRGYYLVALGGRMTREDAVRLQHRARGAGMPRDVYVQNYTE